MNRFFTFGFCVLLCFAGCEAERPDIYSKKPGTDAYVCVLPETQGVVVPEPISMPLKQTTIQEIIPLNREVFVKGTFEGDPHAPGSAIVTLKMKDKGSNYEYVGKKGIEAKYTSDSFNTSDFSIPLDSLTQAGAYRIEIKYGKCIFWIHFNAK